MFSSARFSQCVAASAFFMFVLASLESWSATVIQAKGTKVLVEKDDSEDVFVEGAKFFATVNGKRRAILQITKVQGNRARAEVIKGNSAPVGAVLIAVKKKSSDTTDGSGERSRLTGPLKNMIGGVTVGYVMDSQTARAKNSTATVTEDITMNGSGFALKAFGDLPIFGSLGLLGRVGLEQFNVIGTSQNKICKGSADCKTDILYLSADLLIRYNFVPGQWNPYLGGGLGLYYPMTKSSNVLDESRIAATSVFFVSGGLNYRMSSKYYIPVQIEYGLFPPSNEVTTNFIAIRGGFAMMF